MRRLRDIRLARGVDRARRDEIDRDAVLGEVMREAAREADEAELRGDDVRAMLRAGMRAQAPDVDDRAGPARFEIRQAGLGAMERAVERDAEHVAPFGEGHLLEQPLLAQRRVVDQIIDAAELPGRVRDHLEHRLLVRHIGNRDDRLAAVALDLAHARLGLRPVGPQVRDDRRAAGGQRLRHRAADVASRTGDQRDAARQFLFRAHPRSSFRSMRPSYSERASLSAAAVFGSLHPPWRQLSVNLAKMSARVSGSLAPPRKCGWRSSITLPSASVMRMWPVNSFG